MKNEDHIEAHKGSIRHRRLILSSELCGCFHCLAIFPPSEITDWIDERQDETEIDDVGQTAICPRCGIDSVIGSNSGYPTTKDFLKRMHDHWFDNYLSLLNDKTNPHSQ